MGRKRKNAVYAFFSYNKDSKSSTCLVPGCSCAIKGEHGTNLLYHLSKNHPAEYNIVNERNRLNENDNNSENDKNLENIENGLEEGSVKKARTSYNSQLLYIRTQCVNLVTVHGRPFSLMDDLAFKNIVAMTPITPREQQSINARSIRTSITDAAENVRKKIASDLKNKISLKIDSATRLDRTFFAVNAQYINKGSVTIKTLGVAEMYSRSTSEHLQEKLLHIIRKYRIEVNQIYTITSDNGANMLKLTRLLNEKLNTEEEEDTSDDDLDEEYEDRIYEVTLQTENLEHHSITSMRCAAHSLQLAVQDALRDDATKLSIEEARALVRKLRTPTMKNLLKSAKKNRAILDNATRWHSTLDMLERLKTLRDCCSQIPGEPLYLSNITWDTIDDLINSLKPAKVCTKMLQEEQLTLGDFYYQWTKCYLETSHVCTPLAQQICVFMKIREKNLMTNATLASALYLDPRFKVVLSTEEETMAVKHIKATWLQMIKLEAKYLTEIASDNDNSGQSNTSSVVDIDPIDIEDEMEQILSQTEVERRREQQVRYIQNKADISDILQNFSHHPRLSRKTDILSFWESKILLEPQLYRLAKTVLAVPATQVSVERLFSSLKYVVNNLRSNLNENIVNDILIIRSDQ